MSLSNGFDMRASSLVGQVDAAIERVVAHFEDNDIALRADVLRALAAQAKLAFETERMRQRLRQHPLTRDLIDSISTQSTVFARLVEGLAVHEFSCEYDAQRNVEILATVRWLLKDESGDAKSSKHQKRSKKKQKTQSKVDRSMPLILRYAYARRLVDESTTVVEFRVTSCVGDADTPKELVLFGMSSSSPYPRSFYEDVNGGGLSDDDDSDSDDKQDEDDGDDEVRSKATRAAAAADDASEEEEEDSADGADGDEQDSDHNDSDSDAPVADPHGEAVEAFNFEERAAEDILAWLGEDGIDPADVFGFFLALPVAEDEWQLDERITEIVFNAASEGDDDAASDKEEGEEED